MEIFLCFCVILFVLTFTAVVIKNHWRQKKQNSILPDDLFINKSKKTTNSILQCRTMKNSVVHSDSNGVRIRLSRGGYFSGKVNGKLIELEGPKDKDWEEYYIKT